MTGGYWTVYGRRKGSGRVERLGEFTSDVAAEGAAKGERQLNRSQPNPKLRTYGRIWVEHSWERPS